MRTVPTGRDGDFTTADDAGNLSLDALFAAERARCQGEMDRVLDEMLDDLHRAMRRAERASAAMTARLNAGDFVGAQGCADEFREAMAEFGGFMREAYGELRRNVAARPIDRAQQERIYQYRLGTQFARSQQEVAMIVILLGIVVFFFSVLPTL